MRKRKSDARLLLLFACFLAIPATLCLVTFWADWKARAELASHLENVRLLKFALDSFATDFDGQFPNRATGARLGLDHLGFDYSNDYFRQLFMAGATNSEFLFWVKGSPVCSLTPPDDRIRINGQLAPEEILRAGDCHWAYHADQTNTFDVSSPLLAEPNLAGGKKRVVLRIDGSAALNRDVNPAESSILLVQPRPKVE